MNTFLGIEIHVFIRRIHYYNGEIVKNENILILNDTFFVSDLLIRGPRDAFWPKAKKRRDSTAPSAFKRSGRAEAARSGLAWVCMCDST